MKALIVYRKESLRPSDDPDVDHRQNCRELLEEVKRLRGFVEDQICECQNEWGNRFTRPCARCRLLHGYETWADADAVKES